MRVTNKNAGAFASRMLGFTNSTGSFRGVGKDKIMHNTGRLPNDIAADFQALVNWGFIEYVVYSYGTPIAWYCNRSGWHIPDVSYSVTTSRHQGIVKRAI